MKEYKLRVYPSKETLTKENQLAWKFAEMACDDAPLNPEAVDMVINRVIDNASVALASVNRAPVIAARQQALAHPRQNGATLFGCSPSTTVAAEWAAWANGTAVRELDYHDTFLAADYSHPADNIPPILAVAQQCGIGGEKLVKAILTAYEIHISLVKGICLHKHKIDHIAHLAPAATAGIGTLLNLDQDVIYQAINQAVHTSFTTRQSRKGEISSWKAYAPAHAGKIAIESIDRAMRGEKGPSPIYEGEDSVIAWMLDGPDADYSIPLIEKGESKVSILESYTKEHSAEYQSQALIDLAIDLNKEISDFSSVKSICLNTSHHTHYVIGTGANDPQKMDPHASRETLDHSIMYIFAVALQDGSWHHVNSYLPERAQRPDTVELWHKISTKEDAKWTEKYHDPDPNKKAFGAEVEIHMQNGDTLTREISVAHAHPAGAKPFVRENYINKLNILTDELVDPKEKQRFIELVEDLPNLTAKQVQNLNIELDESQIKKQKERGIFDATQSQSTASEAA